MDTPVLVTVATSVVVAVATLAMAWRAERQASAAKSHLDGNGRGTVPEMLEHLVDWTERHDGRHELLEDIVLRSNLRKSGPV